MAEPPSPGLGEDETFGRDFNASPSLNAAPARSGLSPSLLSIPSQPPLVLISARALASAKLTWFIWRFCCPCCFSAGEKRPFGDLDDDEDDVFASKKGKTKVEESAPGAATGMILSLRESLQNCKENLESNQVELEAAKSEIQKWHSAFQNIPALPAGTNPGWQTATFPTASATSGFMRDTRTGGGLSRKAPTCSVGKEVKKLSWWQKYVLCLNTEVYKENYQAYRERRELFHQNATILHHLTNAPGPPPQQTASIAYKNWNNAKVDWVDLEQQLYGVAPPPVSTPPPVDDDEEEEYAPDDDEDDLDEATESESE